MTALEYQENCGRTMPEDGSATVHLRMMHAIAGIASEAGEIASELQHALQEERDLNLDTMREELGDLLWFSAEMCVAMGTTLNDIMQQNIEKLKKRYPEGFEVWRSEHRHELEGED